MKTKETLKKLLKKLFLKKVKKIGIVKGIGFLPEDNYYVDEDIYLMGTFKLKSHRYWRQEDLQRGEGPPCPGVLPVPRASRAIPFHAGWKGSARILRTSVPGPRGHAGCVHRPSSR